MKFGDSVGFVTGGASGLGLSVVRAIIEAGGRVTISDLASSEGEHLARELGAAAFFAPTDVTSTKDVASAIAAAINQFGRIDLCLNAAGITVGGSTLSVDGTPYSITSFRRVLDVNLIGCFDVCRLAASEMAKNVPSTDGERGVLINVSSIAGLDGTEGQIAYVASKAALAGMTLAMTRDLARWGIRVATICPGVFDTPMLAGASVSHHEHLAALPAFPKRLGATVEFAGVVRTIVETPMLNGVVIRLDGGTCLAAA